TLRGSQNGVRSLPQLPKYCPHDLVIETPKIKGKRRFGHIVGMSCSRGQCCPQFAPNWGRAMASLPPLSGAVAFSLPNYVGPEQARRTVAQSAWSLQPVPHIFAAAGHVTGR